LAITKDQKNEVIAQYGDWISKSRALILTEYKGLTMKQLDELRQKVREAGGEFHIVKNTLSGLAFKSAGLTLPTGFLEGSTAIGFAFEDAPGLAKTMTEFARSSDALKVKGGYLGKNVMSAEQVKALADLPPLPVVRAQLLGALLAPASKLVQTIAEPARALASVFKAYVDKEAAPQAAG
jgi:large subunit ribosomal protein L10